MTDETPVLRGCELFGRPAYDLAGQHLGRVADVVVEEGPDGRYRITEVVVSHRPWGRLLGYERREVTGPWLLEVFARRVLRRDTRRVPWSEVRIGG
jgi:sporulation protein YlmC with PRC-barrel domain